MAASGSLVLVTGACGFSGRHLVRRLLDLGYSVRASDVRPPTPPTPLDRKYGLDLDTRAEFILCDVTDAVQCQHAVEGAAAVFHIGALVPYNLPRSYERQALFNVNVTGTANMLSSSVGAGVRCFLLASSTGVTFGGEDIAGGTEALPVPPSGGRWNDSYSESKALAEALVLAAHGTALPGGGTLRTVALRPNGIWGPGEAHHTPKLLLVAQLGCSWLPFGTRARTDWTHRDELADAFIAAHHKLLQEEAQAKGGREMTEVTASRSGGKAPPKRDVSSGPPKRDVSSGPPKRDVSSGPPKRDVSSGRRGRRSGSAPRTGAGAMPPSPDASRWPKADSDHGTTGLVTASEAVGGRAFFIVAPWKMHTSEFFGPLLTALGFWSPFPSAIVPEGTDGRTADGRVDSLPSGAGVEPCGGTWQEAAMENSVPSAHGAPSHHAGAVRLRRASMSRVVQRGVSALSGPNDVGAPSLSRPCGPRRGLEIILTAEPRVSLPGWALVPVAASLQLTALLLRPCAALGRRLPSWVPALPRLLAACAFEPFLTLADLRKVDRHNYYDSGRAEGALGWRPAPSAAAHMRQFIAYWAELGYDGRVEGPPLGAWVAVVGGLLALGALATDATGVLTAALATLCAPLHAADGDGHPPARAGAQAWAVVSGAAGLGLEAPLAQACAWLASVVNALGFPALSAAAAWGAATERCHLAAAAAWVRGAQPTPCSAPFDSAPYTLPADPARFTFSASPTSTTLGVQVGLRLLLSAALLCHALQGAWAFTHALKWRKAATAWGLQCAVLGFPSTTLLTARAPGGPWDSRAVTAACLGSFIACLPLTAALWAVSRGASDGWEA